MKSLRILVVDDSLLILELFSFLLEKFEVKECCTLSSVEEALETIAHRADEFDVVFTDLNMPGLDGMQFIRILAGYRFRGSVVIISSLDARLMQVTGQLALDYGLKLAGCIEKPIKIKILEKLLLNLENFSNLEAERKNMLSYDEVMYALQNESVMPYYQPKVDIKTQKVKGLEVLARIQSSKEHAMIPACRFVPTVEANNLSSQLLKSVLTQVIQETPRLVEEFGDQITIALNVSPKDLFDANLPIYLAEALEQYNLPPRRFVIEVTESAAIDSPTQIETLSRLRIRGFGLSLDDFGTGYTNIHQLRKLPYTEVKLDRSLAHNISANKLTQVISGSLFDIFSELHLDVVIEGIENQTDAKYFDRYLYPMCFQGYAISMPLSLTGVVHWHRDWKVAA